jgi:hypothetical protein
MRSGALHPRPRPAPPAPAPGRGPARSPRHRTRAASGRGPSARRAELSLYLLAASGLLLWESLGLPWSWAGPLLAAHVAGGIALAAVLIVPFWLQHRRRLQTSRRPGPRRSGRISEWTLLVLLASGLYLFLAGNRGGADGLLAQQLHRWGTVLLLALLGAHMAHLNLFAQLWSGACTRLAPLFRRGAQPHGPPAPQQSP